MANKSINSRLDDLEREPSTDTQAWQLGVIWDDDELQAARERGDKILVWGDDDNIYFEGDHPEVDHGKDT
jgi:hypothetical protein